MNESNKIHTLASWCVSVVPRVIFLVAMLTYGLSAHSEPDADSFLKQLSEMRASLISASGVLDGGHIYSDGEVENSILAFKNSDLKLAGKDLIEGLHSSRSFYEALPSPEWGEATRQLMLIDDWLSPRLAWGNLVVKSQIIDFIARAVYLRVKDGNLGVAELDKMEQMVEQLRWRIPTKSAAFTIAKKHHGIAVESAPKSLVYNDVVTARGNAEREINSITTSNEIEKEVDLLYRNEMSVSAESYSDLYARELVWMLASNLYYEQVVSDLWMYICSKKYLLSVSKENDFSHITQTFPDFIDYCTSAGKKEWFSDGHKAYLKRPGLDPYGFEERFLNTGGRAALSIAWTRERGRFPFNLDPMGSAAP